MSRLGKRPITVPEGVNVEIQDNRISVEGPKGKLTKFLSPQLKIKRLDHQILIERSGDSKIEKSLHGLSRKLVLNMIEGVLNGFEKQLEINGLGYKAQVQKETLVLQVGFTHPVVINIPDGIKIEVRENRIIVKGVDKELVGEIASLIRRVKPAEPYKGKGIKYVDEQVRRKAGKTVVKTTGP